MPWQKTLKRTIRDFAPGHAEPYFDTRKRAALYLWAVAATWIGWGLVVLAFALDPDPGGGDGYPGNAASTITIFVAFGLLLFGMGTIGLMVFARRLGWPEWDLLQTKWILMGGVGDVARLLGWSRRRMVTYVAAVFVGFVGCLIGALIVA